jgi:hypothetical protein
MECKHLLVELEAAGLEEHLSPAAVAHLDKCAHCSGLMADLRAIRNASAELSEAEPPARLWVSLRNQLEAEGLIREAEAQVVASASRPALWVRLRPAMAVAYLAVIAVLGIWIGTSLTPVPSPGPDAMAGLTVEPPPDPNPFSERNPVVAASYTKSLEVIDNFIRVCEKTVREQPNNEVAREYLYDAYKQKADLLAMSMERGAWGD